MTAASTIAPAGNPASIELLQDTLEHPDAGGYQVAERGRPERDRHGRGDHDEHDIEVAQSRRRALLERHTGATLQEHLRRGGASGDRVLSGDSPAGRRA